MRMDNKDIPDPILSFLATQKHTPKISCFHKNSISLNPVLEEELKQANKAYPRSQQCDHMVICSVKVARARYFKLQLNFFHSSFPNDPLPPMILGHFKDLLKGICMEDISLGLMSYIYVIVWFFCARLSHCQPSQVGLTFRSIPLTVLPGGKAG